MRYSLFSQWRSLMQAVSYSEATSLHSKACETSPQTFLRIAENSAVLRGSRKHTDSFQWATSQLCFVEMNPRTIAVDRCIWNTPDGVVPYLWERRMVSHAQLGTITSEVNVEFFFYPKSTTRHEA
jgi:hypothetical protein